MSECVCECFYMNCYVDGMTHNRLQHVKKKKHTVFGVTLTSDVNLKNHVTRFHCNTDTNTVAS
jgi:hypothetical protein